MMESKIVYFEKPGVENTDEVLRIAGQRAEELGIDAIVLASNTGKTGVKAVEAFKNRKVIVITHSVGFRGENLNELLEENRKIIEEKGGFSIRPPMSSVESTGPCARERSLNVLKPMWSGI